MGDQRHIIEQIETCIRQGGGGYRDWFIGLADNPITPIAEVSRLGKVQNHRFTYIETVSHEVAREAADYFISVCGMDGDISETQKNAACRALYLYKKAESLVASQTGASGRSIYRLRDKLFQICAAGNKKVIRRLYAPRP